MALWTGTGPSGSIPDDSCFCPRSGTLFPVCLYSSRTTCQIDAYPVFQHFENATRAQTTSQIVGDGVSALHDRIHGCRHRSLLCVTWTHLVLWVLAVAQSSFSSLCSSSMLKSCQRHIQTILIRLLALWCQGFECSKCLWDGPYNLWEKQTVTTWVIAVCPSAQLARSHSSSCGQRWFSVNFERHMRRFR